MGRGNFLPIVAAALLILMAIGFILFKPQFGGLKPPASSPTPAIKVEGGDEQVLDLLPEWLPEAKWQPTEKSEYAYRDKQLLGIRRLATLIRGEDNFLGFGDEEYLSNLGWRKGDLSADMPGGSAWNYVKYTGGKQRVLLFSYQNRSLVPNPNGGVTAKCPCNYELRVFLSDPF